MSDLLNQELELLTFDIDVLEQERDWHLRAPWDGRLCNNRAWHRALGQMNTRLHELRLDRAALLQSRDEWD